jgi:hypothetical protein
MLAETCVQKTCLAVAAIWSIVLLFPLAATAKRLSNAEIAREVGKKNNQAIIQAFLVYELREVNKYATRPLLKRHPSLVFFINQAERGPLKNLFFLEKQVHQLRKAQKNINSLPYSLVFSSSEKKKILSLKATADRIVFYGIPLLKRDFYRVLKAAKELADKRRKHPIELIPDPAFRDAIYRTAEPEPRRLDAAMGELSEGEMITMRLGWVLEKVTVTRLWLVFNDNKLPTKADYMVFRKKRSEYWKQRMARIFKERGVEESPGLKNAGR